MSNAEQAREMFRQFLLCRKVAPWVADWFVYLSEKNNLWQGPRNCIQRMGGMTGQWGTTPDQPLIRVSGDTSAARGDMPERRH